MDEEFDQQLPSEFAEVFGHMVAASGEGLWAWDIEGNRLFWSARLLTLLGLDTTAHRRDPSDFFNRLHPDDADAVQAALDAHLKHRVPYEMELRMLHEDGYSVPMRASGQASWDADGQPVRMVGGIRNLTVQEILTSTLERVEKLAHIGHWHLNLDTEKLFWSEETYRIHGLDPQTYEPALATAIDLYCPEDRDLVSRRVTRAAEDGTPYDIQARIIHSSGELRHVRAYTDVEKDVSGRPIALFGTFQDITDEVVREERLRKSSELEAIGRLVGGVAHDFNNLLSVIIGNLELLGDTHIDPEQILFLEQTMRAAERGAALTRQLLSFGRKAVLHPKQLSVAASLNEAESMIRRLLPENITVSVLMQDAADEFLADPDQLQSSILNLAINARDAMASGGALEIRSQTLELGQEDSQFDGESLASGRYCVISVSDTGTGMDEVTRQQAIVPFFTTKPVGHGSGLGLSMVHGFTRQSGGALRISSAPGNGPTVKMMFPCVARASARPARRKLKANPPQRGRILVVEDDDGVLKIVRSQLKSTGYEVEIAHDGQQALRLIDDGARFDLILTDIVMPGALQGPDLAEAVLQMEPAMKILFMSGYPREAAIASNGLSEDIVLLQKPIKKDVLLAAVQTALATA